MNRRAVETDARQTSTKDAGNLLIALFWSPLVGTVFVLVIIGAANQMATAFWPSTKGTVTVSERRAARKTSGVWRVEYTYRIAGQEYTSTTYAYDPMPIQGQEEVLRHIAKYPVGSVVDVYFDPENPSDAVLRPGLRGGTLWIALFITPFVLIGIAMWLEELVGFWSGRVFNVRDQVTLSAAGVIMIHLERRRWLRTFLTYLCETTFLVSWALFMFGYGLGAAYWIFDGSALDPPLLAPLSVWAVILAGCAMAARRTVRRTPLLVVDGLAGVITFAPSGTASTGSPPIDVPMASIAGIGIFEQRCHRCQKEGRKIICRDDRYRVQLTCGDGSLLKLAEYRNREDAEALGDLLRQRT